MMTVHGSNYGKALYVSLVAMLSLLLFLVGTGFLGFFLSYFLKVYVWTDYIKNSPSWQYLFLAGILMFIIANLCLYFAEIVIERRWRVIASRFNPKKAILVSFSSVIFCILSGYFGFSWYIYYLYRMFWF